MSTIIGGGGIQSDYVLEISNLYFTGHVEPQTWFKTITGTTRTGLILRDVSLEVGSSNILAILGSKGSGKKALLDIIACRARNGSKKGYVLLNGVNMNHRLFHSTCSYISGQTDKYLMPGLTVHQTLSNEANLTLNVPSSLKKIRVRQILSDVALTGLAGSTVESLSPSERRRLVIGLHLIKDPVVLLADEPAWGLDPLNTYFIISILSNYTKKYGRIVILTMEKPRSDIFPFLDRVTYLCLGDVVYSGNTRQMLDYFRNIGFPCPEIENALIYYLCLATVDRRSHEKFLESSRQIGLLVDKFKLEGNSYLRLKLGGGGGGSIIEDPLMGGGGGGRGTAVTPLHAFGKPSVWTKLGTLILRNYSHTFLFSLAGLHNVFFQLFFLPFLFFLIWIFYFGKDDTQAIYVTYNGLVLNILVATYLAAVWSTLLTFGPFRKMYYQESRCGSYSGVLFILAHTLSSAPYDIITCLIGSRIVFELMGVGDSGEWGLLFLVILSSYSMAKQQTFAAMLTMKSKFVAMSLLSGAHALQIALGSSTVRGIRSLPDWQYWLSHIVQPKWASAFIQQQIFGSSLYSEANLPSTRSSTTPSGLLGGVLRGRGGGGNCFSSSFSPGCRYLNGTHYLYDRYYTQNNLDRDDVNLYLNFGLCWAFPVAALLFSLIVYALPLPTLVKQKFRD